MLKKKFSIVMPIYGNEKNLPVTVPYIISKLDLFSQYEVELVMVSDGSPDNSYEIMKEYQAKYPKLIKIAKFTRNFGQGAAINCGVKLSSGDAVGVISADLQDPFELFVDMLAAWEEGYKFVVGTRAKRPEKGFGGWASKTMHKMINKYINKRHPLGGYDFFLMDRKMADEFVASDAANGFTQLLLLWLGYEYKLIEYERKERTEGKSGFNIKRKLNVATGIFTTYSNLPLRLFLVPSMFSGVASIVFFILFIWKLVVNEQLLSAVFAGIWITCLMGTVILAALVVLGEYIWRIQELSRPIPRYIVDEVINEIDE